jgi:hypothetical protein
VARLIGVAILVMGMPLVLRAAGLA